MPLILESRLGAVATVELNRPERLNAVTSELYSELLECLDGIKMNPEIRAVVLRGVGRAFCVGADLRQHAASERGPAARRSYIAAGQQACRALQALPQAVVVAVHGYAFGAGMELALSADFLVMAKDAVAGFPEVSLGTYVGGGVSFRLPRLVGHGRALDLILTGRRFTGNEAAAWGLAHSAVLSSELFEAAANLAEMLTGLAPLSVRMAKQHLNDPAATLGEAMLREEEGLLACMGTSDWLEGARAFTEKRSPRFEGR